MNPNDATLMEAARILVPFLASLDPGWEAKLDAMDKERGFDDLQKLGVLVAYAFDQDAHMWIPPHPFFQDTHIPAGTDRECPECGKVYKLPYPGAMVCSNGCAATYYAKQKNKEAEGGEIPLEIIDDLREASASKAASGPVGLKALKHKVTAPKA